MKFSPIISILIAFILLATSCAENFHNRNKLGVNPDEYFIQPDNPQSDATKLDIKYEFKEFNSFAEAAAQTREVMSAKADDTVVISTDSAEYLQKLDPIKKSDSTFVIYNDSVSKFAEATGEHFKKSFKGDKVGFIIGTYVTAVEVVTWMHVTTMSNMEISANVAFSIGLAIYFRLNKETWTDITRAIKNPLRKYFGEVQENTTAKRIAYDYVANLALSLGISLARIPLMSMNQITDHGISMNLFTMPLLLSVVGTASFFAWNEHYGNINKDTHPISKFVFGRLTEFRSVILATFASTAALLNPESFGMKPWITLSAIGLAGAIVYLKSDQVNDWIEKNSFLKKYEDYMRKNSGAAPVCSSLF